MCLRHRHLIVALLAACTLGGCNMNNKENLLESLRAYNDAIRWRMSRQAMRYLRGKARATFIDTVDRRGDVRVTHYQIQHVKLVGAKRARVVVRFNWYSELRGRMHRTVMTQHWRRKKGDDDWHLSDQRWVRGPTLPLLAVATPGAAKKRPRGLTGPRKTP
jgi:hypothetical protein